MAGLAASFGSGAMTNPVDDLTSAEVVLLVGSNPTENHPVIGAALRSNARAGRQRLVVIDPRRTSLAEHAALHLRPRPGTDAALLNAIMHVILSEDLAHHPFIAERTEGFEALAAHLEAWTPERAATVTGVPAEDIRAAARLFGEAQCGAIAYCMGVTQHVGGTDTVQAVADLAMLTGNVGRPRTGVFPLRGQNNVQGACDMGALSDLLPGYRAANDPEARDAFAQAWGVQLPSERGLTLVDMMRAAHAGDLKALYIVGENPVVSDPDSTHVVEALRTLDFLVVQDLFLTETAELADVVLPAAAFAEKEGTFTNTERRVQRVRRAVPPPGEARTDLDVFVALGERLGLSLPKTPAETFAEIASLVPAYAGLSHARLDAEGGLQWPVPDAKHPGTPILHTERFARGLGRFVAVDPVAAPELADDTHSFLMLTGRVGAQYHTATMTGRVNGLAALEPGPFVELHPEDALALSVGDGDLVEVGNRRGALLAPARITERVQPGIVFVPMHFAEAAPNLLTSSATDERAGIPQLKATPVRVRRADG